MTNSKIVLIDRHPGRSAQTIGLAQVLGTDPGLIHEPSVGVVGTKGDSQCYLGVMSKVDAIQACLKDRIGRGPGQLALRLVQPEYTIATSDGSSCQQLGPRWSPPSSRRDAGSPHVAAMPEAKRWKSAGRMPV